MSLQLLGNLVVFVQNKSGHHSQGVHKSEVHAHSLGSSPCGHMTCLQYMRPTQSEHVTKGMLGQYNTENCTIQHFALLIKLAAGRHSLLVVPLGQRGQLLDACKSACRPWSCYEKSSICVYRQQSADMPKLIKGPVDPGQFIIT